MELFHADFAPFLVYNLTLAPEQENPWYRGVPQTISCDRFHRCPSRGYWVSKGRKMHLNKAFAADLILYGVCSWTSVDTNHENKRPFARSEFGVYLRLGWKFRVAEDQPHQAKMSHVLEFQLETI